MFHGLDHWLYASLATWEGEPKEESVDTEAGPGEGDATPHGAQELASLAAWLSRALVPCHSREGIFPAACRVPAGHGWCILFLFSYGNLNRQRNTFLACFKVLKA